MHTKNTYKELFGWEKKKLCDNRKFCGWFFFINHENFLAIVWYLMGFFGCTWQLVRWITIYWKP